MRKIISLILAIGFLLTATSVVICADHIDYGSTNYDATYDFVPGEFIIKFKENPDFSSENGVVVTGIRSVDNLNKRYNVISCEQVFRHCSSPLLSSIYKFVFSGNQNIRDIVKEYCDNPSVTYAEPNYIFSIFTVPNDPSFGQQWSLDQSNDCDVDAPQAWDVETGDSEVVIAIIDVGVEYTHSDLFEIMWINTGEDINGNGVVDDSDFNGVDDDGNDFIDDIRGWDFYDNDNTPGPYFHWHGTHCAGIACAMTNNNVGIAGASWNCRIMPVVGLNPMGSGDVDDLANGICYAADNGADIISMSWGAKQESQVITDAIDYAYESGAILIASAGNDGTTEKMYPAASENVISVAATDQNDLKASFSNYGDWVDIAAPGVGIYSTSVPNNYKHADGTSMACPLVAGIAGLVLSKNQELNNQQVRDILVSSVDRFPVSEDHAMGKGRINAYEAILRGPGPAEATITYPAHGGSLYGIENIQGTATGEGFEYYTIEYCEGWHSDDAIWTEMINSSTPVNQGALCSFDSSSLNHGTTYSLRLSVRCNNGVFRDTICFFFNEAPEKPEVPSGPAKGWIYISHEYSTKTTDLEGDQIYYLFEWGDSSGITWLGPYESGQTVKSSHSWNKSGAYVIKVKAKDIYGAESAWSDPLPVVMPRNKAMGIRYINRLIELFPKLFQITRYFATR